MTSWCPDMFEDSPKRNTKRLFLYASQEIAELLRRKHKAQGYVTPDYDYLAGMAWLIGATSAAQALIRAVDLVRTTWGKGDDRKTLLLIKVCAAHVLSAWLGGADGQPRLVGAGRSNQYERAASGMFGVINQLADATPAGVSALTVSDVADAVMMDRQWTSEGEGEGEGHSPVYACLILSKTLEACGQHCMEWSRLSLPVKSVQAFLDTGALLETGLLGDVPRLGRVMDCLAEGVASMKRFRLMNMEGKVQPSGGA